MREVPLSQHSVQEQFGRNAAAYGASHTHTNDDSLLSLESFVAGDRYGTAVDIGTGPGFTAFAVAPHADRVIATDVTLPMLEQVRALRERHGAAGTEMALAAAEALPFADASLDLITCRTAAHHFTNIPAWLGEARRTLRPGGLLVVADTTSPEDPVSAGWMHEVEVRRDPTHVQNLAPSEWRTAVERAGLRVTESTLSKVYLECEDWARRAGMAPEAVERIRRDLIEAPPPAKEAFGIHLREDDAVHFHWDILILRALKSP